MSNRLLFAISAAAVLIAAVAYPARKSQSTPPAGRITFKKTVLDREFRSEGVAVADVNRDGKPDILAGSFWYEAPDWKARELAPVKKYDPAAGYSDCFLSWSRDMNKDKWPDQIVVGFPGDRAVWRENPRGGSGPWKEHIIWRSACNESPAYAELLGKGKWNLVFPFDESQMAWYEPQSDPAAEYLCRVVGEPKGPGVQRFSHGMGVGDINGDKRADIITPEGWYQQPENPKVGPWPFVNAKLGPLCAQMYAYDVNADGLNDVVSSSAHAVGVWWYEQIKPGEFVQHTIDDSFSQSHSLVMADIDRDGTMDFVTGKRWWAHGPSGDINPNHPAVLVWYELKRGAKPQFIRRQIDDDSGVGTQFTVADVNKDGRPDIVTSNKKGVHYFEQQK